MNSTNLRGIIYVLLISSVTALGIFSYLSHKKSENIQEEIRNINIVVHQYGDQVENTNKRLDKTNSKLSTIKRKISSLRKFVTSNPDYNPDKWINLKNQVDNILSKTAKLHGKFENIENKVNGINSRMKMIEAVQNDIEKLTTQTKINKTSRQTKRRESGDALGSLLDNIDIN